MCFGQLHKYEYITHNKNIYNGTNVEIIPENTVKNFNFSKLFSILIKLLIVLENRISMIELLTTNNVNKIEFSNNETKTCDLFYGRSKLRHVVADSKSLA